MTLVEVVAELRAARCAGWLSVVAVLEPLVDRLLDDWSDSA